MLLAKSTTKLNYALHTFDLSLDVFIEILIIDRGERKEVNGPSVLPQIDVRRNEGEETLIHCLGHERGI